MGITQYEIGLLDNYIQAQQTKSVIELGSQNLYTTGAANPPFADVYYKTRGVTKYNCIDMAGDNHALKLDLSHPLKDIGQYDMVTDFGTSEHVVQSGGYQVTAFHDGYINSIYPIAPVNELDSRKGFYNCWLNKFNLCKDKGLIISVNPKTGNWPGHGYTYIDKQFYKNLELNSGLLIIMLEEHAAMGNTVDGINIVSVMQKRSTEWPTFDEFNWLDVYNF